MNDQLIHQNRVRQFFFLTIIVLLGCLLAWQFASFLPAFLGALALYIVFRTPMRYLTKTRKWSKSLTAVVIMLISFLVVMVPIAGLVTMMSGKVSFAIQHSNELIASLEKVVANLESKFGVHLLSTDMMNKFGAFLAQSIPGLITGTIDTLGTLFFMYFILYFMLVSGEDMERAFYEYVPLNDDNVDKLGKEIEIMVFSNAVGIPVIGVLQGIVAVVGYLLIGVKEPWFWFVVTCITAMLPVVGAALAYVPLSIIFFANDQIWQGVVMLIYGFGVIGTIDNVFRFTLAKKFANVHPLITVFGVIIGLKLFGFLGLIFGPLLISLFILLVRIYSSEFFVKQREAPPSIQPTEKNT